ncbi:conserved hypothetical protein [Shewanella loihica PV-4]|uniref:DUF998 domain-containing protein n=2 Tax=Shewanellaceae TaxID=267890 RepID=A3QHU7_SHELP|nr:conserved hypothetical protein [Shewanella loihica PV-4]TVP14401.1 hypothetical protein AYI87_11250 [Shewanella sp. KCT]
MRRNERSTKNVLLFYIQKITINGIAMALHQPINYDLQRMVVFTILTGALISALGISISLFAKFQVMGLEAFNQRPDLLGNYVDSPLAYIFNMGLILAGSCILLAMYGLLQLKLGHFGNYIAFAGFVVGVTIILIGIYPINYLKEHRLFSTIFLIATIILYFLTLSARVNHKAICSTPLFIVSALGLTAASSLALMVDWGILDFAPCSHHDGSICGVAFAMWAQTNLVMIWCVTLALTIKKLARHSYQDNLISQVSAHG